MKFVIPAFLPALHVSCHPTLIRAPPNIWNKGLVEVEMNFMIIAFDFYLTCDHCLKVDYF